MDVEFSVPTQRSREEEDEFQRSVKKFKESDGARSFLPPRKLVSYKDSLVGDIPGAYAQAFKFNTEWEDDYESEDEMEPLIEGMAEVKLSKETKARIRAPWSRALIVKVYGRSVGFNYLTFKLNAMWKPTAKMDCVAMGKGFFLVRFSGSDDYDFVLRGGPWFIGEHFLAIKPWEPYFIASEAKLTSVAVWVRLPELPIEFYDAAVLRKIGSVIGPVLRIDSFTASETRGGYARLCVQIDLEKPLISSIRVGRLVQKVLYEGISSLCFCCGKLGHKQDSCGLKRKEPNSENVAGVTLENNEASGEVQSDFNYGPWMVVTRKKKNQSRMGKASGPGKINIHSQVDSKGIVDISQASVRVEASEDLNKLVHCDPVDSNSETTRVGADLNMQSALEMRNDCMMEECLENSRDGCQLDSRHSPGNKRKGIVKNKGKGTESLGIRNAKTSKNHKRLPSSSEGKSGLLLLSKELGSGNQVENGEIFDRTDTTTKIRVGNLVQEPCGGHSRGDNSSDKSGANGNTGMVRGRTETGVEASVSHNTREYQFGGPSFGAQGLGSHTQSMVELPHGRAGDLM
ncbi:uncharacterized protein LOC136068109 [Quercus suber]|uniref:uncharacterized protein LOC136068109 n=1 Tax=Quercus suber TaxID=58331 RepID=UPI0032DE7E2D